MRPPVVGIFVGGQARRMGGVAKGNLIHDGRTILERTLQACWGSERPTPDSPRVYLVGNSSAYAADGTLRIDDEPRGIGPIGGLRALLRAATVSEAPVVALAGDMPFLTRALVERLFFEEPQAAALAPREESRWQPLFARYAPAEALPAVEAVLARGETALQGVLTELGERAAVLELSESERAALIDWDRPNDVNQRCPESTP
jgi:molybdopterin-guanine dinucleotide biosynthesis protein A